jgi:hypothetical protein
MPIMDLMTDPEERHRRVALVAGLLVFAAGVLWVWLYPPG